MDVSAAVHIPQQHQQHQQLASPKKPGVLRSIMSKDHRRSELQRTITKERDAHPVPQHHSTQLVPLLPPDHPHAAAAAAHTNADHNTRPGRPLKQENTTSHKRSKSTVSLRSLGRSKDKDKEKDGDKEKDKERRRREKQAQAESDENRKNLKKTKSTTSLRNLLSKNRSSKDLNQYNNQQSQHDKENVTPSQSQSQAPAKPADTPIWSQFATPSDLQDTHARPQQQQQVDAEIARYTPRDYSPSKQRDFAAYGPPTLHRPDSGARPPSSGRSRPPSSGRPVSSNRPTSSGRPKSGIFSASTAFMDIVSRKISNDRTQPRTSGDGPRPPSNHRSSVDQSRQSFSIQADRKTSAGSDGQPPARPTLSIAKRGSRVMAAVAALNGKTQDVAPARDDAKLDPKAVDTAFEAVLDSRNIPEHMRQKMRTLTLRVKADFVKQDRGASTPISPTKSISRYSMWSGDDSEQVAAADVTKVPDEMQPETKTSRARSKTFTFTKSDASPTKKQKSESRPNSIHIPKTSGTSSALPSPSIGSAPNQSRAHQPAAPEDFVAYLRKMRDPTQVEVGRLHKLRLLLRNETVAWVDLFISLGGMCEVIDLLHRIMAIEWREEHEDQLLHETLLCLKGLCTTEVALAKLEEMADTLFSGLLALLFDEEKKGPSEFNTRAVIVNILFAHLTSACRLSPEKMAQRARSVLGYLRGPEKPEDAQPIGFVLEMRQPRPYRVWCNEVSSVSREVFWIFLHHLNVIPLPKRGGSQEVSVASSHEPSSASRPGSRDANATSSLAQSYTKRHFPGDRPPVPAAPYIGGVEWDATTYMTAHLDLLNGLIASLPTRDERNELRAEFKASGWEKVMGTTLRTCKEKFYCGVHSGLQSWIAAALEDGWDIDYVRYGPTQEELAAMSPRKSPKKSEPPPKIEAPILDLPRLDLGLGITQNGHGHGGSESDGWLM